jgi:nucleoside-diphosphate-sugar epimerase
MTILVTGASGFIGSALLPVLAAKGHETRSARLDADSLDAQLSGCDAVVHLANIAHARASRELLWRINVEGTRRLAERAAAARVRRLVYVSSIKASGEETSAAALDGSETPAPTTEYGKSKLSAERALAEVAARTGIESVVLRPPLVYGAGVKANFLALIRAVDAGWPLPFASVQNRRSLVYAGNLADVIARCVDHPEAAGRTYVMSDGAPVSTPALCRALGAVLSRPARLFNMAVGPMNLIPPLRPLLRNLEVDDSILRKELGWAPPFSFGEGLQATARWYRGG